MAVTQFPRLVIDINRLNPDTIWYAIVQVLRSIADNCGIITIPGLMSRAGNDSDDVMVRFDFYLIHLCCFSLLKCFSCFLLIL